MNLSFSAWHLTWEIAFVIWFSCRTQQRTTFAIKSGSPLISHEQEIFAELEINFIFRRGLISGSFNWKNSILPSDTQSASCRNYSCDELILIFHMMTLCVPGITASTSHPEETNVCTALWRGIKSRLINVSQTVV